MIYVSEIQSQTQTSPIQYRGITHFASHSIKTEVTLLVYQSTFLSHEHVLSNICLQGLEQELGITKQELKEAFPEKFI